MTTPNLTHPILYTSAELRSKPAVATSMTQLANQAFYRSKANDPIKWNNTTFRFPNLDALHNMLGEDSIVALMFDYSQRDNEAEAENDKHDFNKQRAAGFEYTKLIACAAAVPWKGGWAKESAGIESGWEIKAVCVDGDEKYLHRGLAQALLSTLEHHLIAEARLQLRRSGARDRQGELILWILAAECINGVYWRKRGYHEVRRKTEGVGVWSCKTSFEMVVFRKYVRFDISSPVPSVTDNDVDDHHVCKSNGY
ncbi:hypothetical protein BKA66DRAFT_463269 [Pyrenochaeta sp. MPI-SDFR-AT-0127]|nr:hypothetical protein BKA66DRAFT_463269 [Pyrenochaeta sp. MPI-SDFR-AT-0127]